MDLLVADPVTLERFVRPSQLARALGVSVESVRKYCRAGRIPARTTTEGEYLIPQRVVNILKGATGAPGRVPLRVVLRLVREGLEG